MNQPMKVLLVQRCRDQGRLRQHLEREPGLEFEWQRLFSENELRLSAREFAPTVVVCADAMNAGPRDTLEMLKMMSTQRLRLLISEICDDSAPWSDVGEGSAVLPCGMGLSVAPSKSRTPLPAIWREDLDAVLMLDGNGWVTDLNPHAQRLLGIGPHSRPKAQAHVQDLIRALQAAGEGHSTSLPLVTLNLDGMLLLNAGSDERCGDAALDLISSIVQPQFARCGFLARIGVNQYLAKMPHMSPPADAAVSVSRGRQPVAGNLTSVFGVGSVNDSDVLAPAPIRLTDHAQHAQPNVAADLREAIQRRTLSVHFQPQFELSSGRGCGAEALVRWTLASGRNLAPDLFIPLAERSGTIGDLDAWVLQTACDSALRWRGAAAERLTLSVNVSSHQMSREYSRTLADVLRSSRFPPHRLELEIDEEPIISNDASVRYFLEQWQQLGVRLAVNHRSANYSSLNYLSRMKVDRLKIDKALVHKMTQHRRTAATVQAIIALGAEFDVAVIAEGVETKTQLAMLGEFDCPQAQGYLLARPMPAVQAKLVLDKTWGNLGTAHQGRASVALSL